MHALFTFGVLYSTIPFFFPDTLSFFWSIKIFIQLWSCLSVWRKTKSRNRYLPQHRPLLEHAGGPHTELSRVFPQGLLFKNHQTFRRLSIMIVYHNIPLTLWLGNYLSFISIFWNNNNQYLLNMFYVPGMLLNALIHFISSQQTSQVLSTSFYQLGN